MEPASLTRQIRLDSSDSSCSNYTRSIASLGGSEDSILEERTASYRSGRQGSNPRQLSDGFSPDEQDSGFNSNPQLESCPNNGNLRCRTPDIKSPRRGGSEDSDDVWLPRFPRPRKLGMDRTLGTSGSLGSTDSWIENSVSEEDEDMDDGDIARCLTSMSLGSGVVKVTGSGRCTVKTLYLDGNKSCVRWRPSKKGNKAKISIDSIKEIRQGPNTDSFKKYLAAGNRCHAKICFSIIHGSSWDTLDLILETEEETAIWIRGLKHLLKGVKSEVRRHNSSKLRDCWLKATFEAADKSGDGLLSMDEVLKLLHKLNVNLSKRKVKQLFKEADNQDDNIGKLDFDEFIHFYRTISTRQEVDLLLKDYGHGKGYMTLQEFARYLREEQGMGDVELELCQELVQTYEPIPENAKNGWIGIDGFTRFLLSHEGDIFNPAHREVNQDMTRPLTHYYIASSHNTYLVGDQLMSQSSVDVYALVLQAGCRCVEMDCWDGKDGEPIIYHGYTLTSKIKFRDVISIISKYAFVTSPYPVILSIENHCSLEQQKKMAQYLVEILGEMLHVPTIDPSRTTLPSPEELKGKILIKAKKLPQDHNENLEAGEVSEEDSADELDDELKLERSSISKKFESVAMAQLMLMRKKPITPTRSAWQRIVSKVREDSRKKDSNSKNHARSSSLTGTLRRLKLSKKKPKSQSSSESSEGGSLDLLEKSATDEETTGDQSSTVNPKLPSPLHTGRSHKGKSMVLCRQLSELVQLTRSVGFRGFKSTMASWELPSLGEMRASNLVATKAPDFAQFTASHLCRVYPSAYRIDSSNYNPQPMWNCGCQLVALNYQTEGRPMQLSRAKFSLNGNCGYALKHSLLCDEHKPFDPNSGDPVPHLPKKQLTLHIISGQQLPKPPQSLLGERGEIIDPYVEAEVIGLPVDCAKSQTKTIQDNGFNPFWDCTMTFTIHLLETALIRFAVWDEDPIGRDFIGQATFPVASLMPGYRHVHLEGLDQATLFVHVTVEDYNSWVNNTARFKPRGSQCRTKSVELDYSPLSSPTHHRQSPRRKSSLGLVQKLNMRRRHSMAALPPRELSPLPAPGTRMKRRSYEEGHVMTGSAGELRPGGGQQ
ncbi:1-phosphatidylinositol 4,5-bisphosphate phosphodiesterase eta-2-like isoform X2 [Patiria miniata]|uniref:Phosphoinositide phospholipase C n=1 Tax=Patiria miniata TaxID=46514 RepID=A0A914BFR0_PATMI|nr:1-phosphatidylinositol 4,5-bisphosphate phosphodiesterase eta-2-like isoform X2 [Patiria miniata]